MRWSLLLTALLVAFAGCSDNVAEPQTLRLTENEVPTDGSNSGTVGCPGSAELRVSLETDDGFIQVKVREASNVPIFEQQFRSTTQFQTDLSGGAGVWTMEVSRGREPVTFQADLIC